MRKIIGITIIKNFEVELTYDNGKKVIIDFKKKIDSASIFQPLNNQKYFSKISLASNGRYISWDDEIEFCADGLWYEGTGENFSMDEKEAS